MSLDLETAGLRIGGGFVFGEFEDEAAVLDPGCTRKYRMNRHRQAPIVRVT